MKKNILRTVSVGMTLALLMQSNSIAMSDYKNEYKIDYMDEVYRFDTGEFLEGYDISEETEFEIYIEILKSFGIDLLPSNGGKTYKSNAEYSDLYSALAGIISPDSGLAEDYRSDKFKGSITMSEALPYMEDALGYAEIRERLGVMKIASDNGILKGLSYNPDRYFTIGELALMLWNTLNAYGVQTSFEDKSISYTAADSKLMERQLDIYEISGFLNAADGKNIYKNTSPGIGYAEIDRTKYITGASGAENYLGKRVTAYVRGEADEDRSILFIREEKDSVNITVNFRDVLDMGDYLEYEDSEGKVKKADIRNLRYILLNGDAVNDISVLDSFSHMDGEITVSSTERKGKYDTAVINSYSYYIIYSVDTYEGRINLKDGAEFKGNNYIEIPEDELLYCTLDGEKISYEELSPGNVIRVLQNTEKTYTEICASSNTVIGRVNGLNSQRGTVVIGESEYRVAKSYESLKGAVKIESGLFGTFYVSSDRYIAGYKEGSEASYGYLKKLYIDEETEKVKISVFGENGKWYTYTLKDKITLDGQTGVKAENAFNIIKNNNASEELIRYKVNGYDEITFIDTISDEIAESEDENRLKLSYEGTVQQSWMGGYWFRSDMGYRILSTSPVFQIPANTDKTADYKAKTAANLNSDQQNIYIRLYSADDFGICSAAVIGEGKDSMGNETTYWFYCESMADIWDDENDEAAYEMKGLRLRAGKTEISDFTVKARADLAEKTDGLAPGSLMKITYASDGYLTAAEVVFKDAVLPEEFNNVINGYYQYFCGTIVGVDTEREFLAVQALDKKYVLSVNNAICINKDDLSARAITLGDLIVGEKIYVYRAAGGGRICAIVR